MLLLTFGLAVFAATAAAATPAALHTVYPEPALPSGWASQSSDRGGDEVSKVTLAVREQNMDTIRAIALDV